MRRVVIEAANRVPRTLKGLKRYREPLVWLVGLGDNGLDFELVVWVNRQAARRYRSTQAAYMWEIETALKERGFETINL